MAKNADSLPSNMDLWDRVCKTDPDRTKPVSLGSYKYTAINAQYQLQKATAEWGPYGSSWGLQDLRWTMTQVGELWNLALDAEFGYPGGRFPISVDMRFDVNADCRKKLLTEARSKALSYLGFDAEIFLGQWDDNKYVQEVRQYFDQRGELRNQIIPAVKTANSQKAVDGLRERLKERLTSNTIDEALYLEAMTSLDKREKELSEMVEQ